MTKIYIPRKGERFLGWAKNLYFHAERMHKEWGAPHPKKTLLKPLKAWEDIMDTLQDAQNGGVNMVVKANARRSLAEAGKTYLLDYVVNNPAVSDKERRDLACMPGAVLSRRKDGDRRKKGERRKNRDRRKQPDGQKQKEVILLVDDIPTNLLAGKNVLSKQYAVTTASSAEKMFRYLENNNPAMILLDIDMPEMNGYEAIKILKTQQHTKNIPVIFVSARTEAADELEGLNLGAIDYIVKPYDPSVLLKRIEIRLAGIHPAG